MKIKRLEGEAPDLQKMPRGDLWRVDGLWSYRVYTTEGVLHFVARVGYLTDLASVPKPLRGIIDNGSGDFAVMVSAMCHDISYSSNGITREMADWLFREMLVKLGMSRARAWLYYAAVRAFGGPAYESDVDKGLAYIQWLDK